MEMDLTIVNILQANIDDFNKQVKREIKKEKLQAAKRRGAKFGNPNLADVRNTDPTNATKKLIENADEYSNYIYKVIKKIESEYGNLTTRKLAGHLNEAGYKTSRNKPFSAMAVSRIKARMKKAEEQKKKDSVDFSRHAARDFKTVTLRLNAYEHARLQDLAAYNKCGVLKTIRMALDNSYDDMKGAE